MVGLLEMMHTVVNTSNDMFSEKCYTIDKIQKLKSVPPLCHKIAKIHKPFAYTAIKIHPILGMSTQIQQKQLNLLLIPRKRYFVNQGKLSYPLEL